MPSRIDGPSGGAREAQAQGGRAQPPPADAEQKESARRLQDLVHRAPRDAAEPSRRHGEAGDPRPGQAPDGEPGRLPQAPVGRRERDGGGSGDGGQERDRGDTPGDQAWSGGDAILAGLGMVPAPPPAAAAAVDGAAPATPATHAADLSSLVDQVASRVLVGQRADGASEIRMTLRGPTLDGTEVRIALHQGRLEVHIAPGLPAAQDMLRVAGSDLSATLAERLGQPVVVEVQAGGQGGAQGRTGDEGGGRSRTYDDIIRYVSGGDG